MRSWRRKSRERETFIRERERELKEEDGKRDTSGIAATATAE